mgnify:CR=1 FL=1
MLDHVTSSTEAADTDVVATRWRRGRAIWMLAGGVVLLAFALVHAVWTGWHAPLAAWVAPVGALLAAGGAWSLAARRPVPRWWTVLTVLAAVVLTGLLIWMGVLLLNDRPRLV